MRIKKFVLFMLCLLTCWSSSSCGGTKSFMGIHEEDRGKPISNPFFAAQNHLEANQNMILRTRRGDRSVELEIPGDVEKLSDFVLPVGNAFKDKKGGRSLASLSSSSSLEDSSTGIDESYKTTLPSASDREITQAFPHGSPDDDMKRGEIERGLNLTSSEDNNPTEGQTSYLAGLDHIKQLYKSNRFEAALVEADGMVRLYPTDPKLYEMRGTLLDRLGKRDLAVKAWSQSLRFNPKNESLRKFIDHKVRSLAGASS